MRSPLWRGIKALRQRSAAAEKPPLFGLPLLCSDSKIGMYDGSSQLRYTAAMRVTNTRSVPVINAAG